MTTRTRMTRVLAAGIATLALGAGVLAACGSDNSNKTDGSTTTTVVKGKPTSTSSSTTSTRPAN